MDTYVLAHVLARKAGACWFRVIKRIPLTGDLVVWCPKHGQRELVYPEDIKGCWSTEGSGILLPADTNSERVLGTGAAFPAG